MAAFDPPVAIIGAGPASRPRLIREHFGFDRDELSCALYFSMMGQYQQSSVSDPRGGFCSMVRPLAERIPRSGGRLK
jgi:hypothetical protein